VADLSADLEPPLLWNPNAAANWSLLFSPAFGSFLHMKNWEALGEPVKAAAAKRWFVITLVALVGLVCANVVFPTSKLVAASIRPVGLVLLLAWYFGSARAQVAYVKTKFGKSYPRRGWLKPLAIAVLALVVLVVVMSVIVIVVKSVA